MKKLLFLDIETDSLDISQANIKFIGCLEENGTYKVYNLKKDKISDVVAYISKFDTIITFNGDNYDLPILKNHKIDIPNYKHIDLYKVFKKKAVLLRSGGFKSYSLNNIAKEIKLEIEKGEIDYKLFEKDKWTQEELQQIETYLKQDLNLTKELWLFLIKKFDSLKEYISQKDAENFKHITMSSGAYGYKVICNLLGIKEEYNDIEGNKPYEGAYVMSPKKETIRGNILYFDFASLYPMMYIHANLFSPNCKCCKQEEKWHGNENFKIDGYYCSKQQGKIEKLVKELFLKRKQYKKDKDNREFAIKIFLNCLYGISAKPSFKNIYNENTASDCTALARQCISYAIKEFELNDYEVIYADTDSCLVELKENQTKLQCMKLTKDISEKISRQFPFPFEEFSLKLEDEIKYLQFFNGRDGTLNKKQYIYINKDNKITIKGLDIIRKDCSELSQMIFNDYLKEDIIKKLDCKFEKELIDNIIHKIINEDKMVIAKRFNIKPLSSYKSKTSIYYLIGKKYGDGEIFLIKNYKLGVGRGISYCSLEEAKDLDIKDLDLCDVYKELGYFIKEYEGENKKDNKIKKIKDKKVTLNKIMQMTL